MKFNKKLVIGLVSCLILLAAGFGGAVLAADNGDTAPTTTETQTRQEILLERIAASYLELTGQQLDTEALTTAYKDAIASLQADALQNRLDKLVEEGVLTQQEADDLAGWWAERPDVANNLQLGPRLQRGMPRFGTGPCCPGW